MYKVKDIARKIEELAPLSLAEPWDNVGLMVGDMNADISRVFVCLDVTSENAAAAIDCGANLIVSDFGKRCNRQHCNEPYQKRYFGLLGSHEF